MRTVFMAGSVVALLLAFAFWFPWSSTGKDLDSAEPLGLSSAGGIRAGAPRNPSGSTSRHSAVIVNGGEETSGVDSSAQLRELLEVPASYPFDPNAPLPVVEFSPDGGAMVALARAIRDDRGGVNPLKKEISEEKLREFCAEVAPDIQVHQALIKDLVKAQGLAGASFRPVLGRTFSTEKEAQRFGEEIFGAHPKSATRAWGIWDRGSDGGAQNFFVYYIDPKLHVEYYRLLEKLVETDKLLRNRILTLTLSSS